MIAEIINFECITPCFCAGAEQTQAEIRPSSIRGSLRWWFRALGGNHAEENAVFGGPDPIRASSLQIRVANLNIKSVGRLPEVRGIDPLSYILYFPSVSSDKTRWNPNACLGPKTTFELQLRQTRKLTDAQTEQLQKVLLAFRHFGSIGMHVTRALGAIQDQKATPESFVSAISLIESHGFTYRQSDKPHIIWDAVLKEAGQWLQNDMRKEFGAGGNKKPAQATALGSALPVRQTSAVYLRPIKQNDNLFFAAFEAPHNRVLGSVSKTKHTQPILQSRDFTKTPPQAPQQGR
jgi:CRISPR type III-B/RAMP module RAMP protein Cmr1